MLLLLLLLCHFGDRITFTLLSLLVFVNITVHLWLLLVMGRLSQEHLLKELVLFRGRTLQVVRIIALRSRAHNMLCEAVLRRPVAILLLYSKAALSWIGELMPLASVLRREHLSREGRVNIGSSTSPTVV